MASAVVRRKDERKRRLTGSEEKRRGREGKWGEVKESNDAMRCMGRGLYSTCYKTDRVSTAKGLSFFLYAVHLFSHIAAGLRLLYRCAMYFRL